MTHGLILIIGVFKIIFYKNKKIILKDIDKCKKLSYICRVKQKGRQHEKRSDKRGETLRG